ncbi:MAG: multiple sugar transport system substrate-binding protein [Pseudonocardiales bacterium]|jgi:ABC-type glycerol-3-phosphate transport system substrate-binding protein|nr:extracellular solute-binding protein family 1 [Frankiales bacterium]MDQ1737014.1 multiple sugar transport system substrate-binding protein [Pseudonocardiales bacterium]
MRSTRKAAIVFLSTTLSIGMLAACSSSKPAKSAAKDGKVKLTIVSLKPGSEKAAIATFNEQVKQFEDKNPNIDLVPKEYEWKATTFAAQLAGGTLPEVFTIPFTDGKTLIQRKQLADLTSQVKALPYAPNFNPKVLDAAQDTNGNIFGIPYAAYGVGLQYNRTLFKQAGLDPDKPPTTWDEIRADAKQIADKTGKAGYAQMTQNGTGGWMLTTLTYALGGRMEQTSGDKVTASVNNAQTKAALQKLHDMRWGDNSMGSNFLFDWGGMNQAFAAGKVGMYMGGSDVYTSLVQQNKINPADYGLAVLPLDSSADAGILGGGTLAVVSAKASQAQKDAAVKWIDFYYMRKLTEQSAATLDAKTLIEGKQPVGTPALPIFDKATLDKSNAWIASYINVPLPQMKSFTDGVFSQTLVAEPAKNTQELYGALDPVVQAVLSNKNADIGKLLDKANTDIQNILDRS